MTRPKIRATLALGLATFGGVATMATPARADTNLVFDGGFDQTTMTSPQQMDATNVTGWSTSGYNFVYFPGSADTTGSFTPQFNGAVSLWGPNNGSANGLTAASPAGGNFVAADGAYETGAITQTVDGLTVGEDYALTFDWAGAQQDGFTGATTEAWIASLGGQSIETPIVDNVSHGFTGWQTATFVFAATETSEALSFLAQGTPDGVPPFSLLANVRLVDVPEPATLGLALFGVLAVGGVAVVRRRRARA